MILAGKDADIELDDDVPFEAGLNLLVSQTVVAKYTPCLCLFFFQIAQANAGNDEDQAQDETLDENPEEMDIESPPEETDESNIPGQVDGEEDGELPTAEETDQNEDSEQVGETANEEEINDNDTGPDDMQDDN